MGGFEKRRFVKALMLLKMIHDNDEANTELQKAIQKRRQRRMALILGIAGRRMANIQNNVNYCAMEFVDPIVTAIINRNFNVTKLHLRVTPDSLALLCTKLKANKMKDHGWAVEFEAMVFLYWLATGTCFRVVSHCFQLARSTAHMICSNVLNEMLKLVHQVIRLPAEEEMHEIGLGFEELAGSPVFRSAVGAIDGCQVRTLVPTALHDQYINRKLYYSINLQGVVDHRGFFIDINAGFPGSVHDMRVLRHSYIWRTGTYPPDGFFILGDGGYQTRLHPICMITPFRAPLTADQSNFNHHHSKGRCVVERAFGMMQVRWRSIYTKALEVKLKSAVKVITACAIMHNICLTAGDVLLVNNNMNHQPPREHAQLHEVEGVAFRNILLHLHTLHRNQEREGME